MKAVIENGFIHSEFLPMRGDKLETGDSEVTVAGVSCTQITVCGNLTGMMYMLELVGMKGRFQWRKRSVDEPVLAAEPEPSLDETYDPDWKNG
jgi:hypothetical protein